MASLDKVSSHSGETDIEPGNDNAFIHTPTQMCGYTCCGEAPVSGLRGNEPIFKIPIYRVRNPQRVLGKRSLCVNFTNGMSGVG